MTLIKYNSLTSDALEKTYCVVDMSKIGFIEFENLTYYPNVRYEYEIKMYSGLNTHNQFEIKLKGFIRDFFELELTENKNMFELIQECFLKQFILDNNIIELNENTIYKELISE